MKKTVFLYNVFLTIFFFSVFFATACGAGLGDWEVELPNNYRVIHLNSQDIRISYDDKDGSSEKVKINSFIKEFAFDDRYVYARTIESILNNDISSEKYYVVDTLKDKLYGPFDSLGVFEDFIGTNDLQPLYSWKTTQLLYNPYDEENNDTGSFWDFLDFLGHEWKYDLPGGYCAVESGNDYDVTIRDKYGNVVIDSFVKEFMCLDKYVVTRNADSIASNNIFNESYFILDTEQNEIYGEFSSYEELEQALWKLGMRGHYKWLPSLISTKSVQYESNKN